MVQSEIIAFLDDDISFGRELFHSVLRLFENDPTRGIGGVSPRMANSGHPVPSPLLRTYYRWQAGFEDETYGARLFGFGINIYPCYTKQTEAIIEADWLNSPCLFLRREDFMATKFPKFHGYSAGEDAYLTGLIKKRGKRLLYLSNIQFTHHAEVSDYKSRHFELGRMKTINQGRIAREVLGLKGWLFWSRKIGHKIFISLCLIRQRNNGWFAEMAGIWTG